MSINLINKNYLLLTDIDVKTKNKIFGHKSIIVSISRIPVLGPGFFDDLKHRALVLIMLRKS